LQEQTTGKKLLVVDDEPEELFVVARMLRKAGYLVEEAHSGAEAIDKARQFAPDLILLDVVMPGEDGFEICEQIKSDRELKEIFVVLVSGMKKTPEYQAKGLNAGADGFIVRPFHSGEFEARIGSLMRKAVETKLYEQQRWLQSTLSSIGDGLVATDEQERIVFMNPVAEKITGWMEEEAQLKNIGEIISCACGLTDRPAKSPIGKVLEEGVTIHLDDNLLLIDRNQERISVAASVFPIRHEDGSIVGGILVFRDNTERKRIEQTLIRSERLLVASELSAGMCHNLNNLLTGVMLPAAQLRSKVQDPKLLVHIETILAASRRAADLVQRLHVSVSGQSRETYSVNLNAAIEEAIRLTEPHWNSQPDAQGIDIDLQAKWGEVPPIRGTEVDVQEMVANLIFNAVEAMPEGGEIALQTQGEGDFVRLSFSDSGIGMEEQLRRRVFEPFFTTKMDVGSGLGLSALHGTLTKWGGKVEVESTPGQGTTFVLYFPVWSE